MIKRYPYRNLEWVDLESPTREEVREVMERFNIHPLVAEELLLPSMKPKVDLYPNCIYLILHFPAMKHTYAFHPNQEVDFVIGKDFLITTRYDTVDPLHKFGKVFEVNSILEKQEIGEHAGYLFFYMISKLYKSLHHELDFLRDSLAENQNRVFSGEEKRMVYELSKISRSLTWFGQALRLHREVLKSFKSATEIFFGKEFNYHGDTILSEYYRVEDAITGSRELLEDLRETNNSLLETKQNETIKVLTIMAFLTLPITSIAQIFSMSTRNIPIVGSPHDFWEVIGLMILSTSAVFLFFKYKKWF